MSRKLIIDVTQLIHWPGRLTGIPRVMNELAARYASQDNVVFVAWAKENKKLYRVDLAATLATRGSAISFVPKEVPAETKPKNKNMAAAASYTASLGKVAAKVLRKLDST